MSSKFTNEVLIDLKGFVINSELLHSSDKYLIQILYELIIKVEDLQMQVDDLRVRR